jgi:hypothetical protein
MDNKTNVRSLLEGESFKLFTESFNQEMRERPIFSSDDVPSLIFIGKATVNNSKDLVFVLIAIFEQGRKSFNRNTIDAVVRREWLYRQL